MRCCVLKCWSPAQKAIVAVSSGQLLIVALKAKTQLGRTQTKMEEESLLTSDCTYSVLG